MTGRLARSLRPHALRWTARLRRAEYWLIGQAARLGFALLGRLPPDRALDFAAGMARRVGPWFGRHRTALANLRRAYPEKSEEEIEAIALDMWGHMARLAAEYVCLDQLFDYDPERPGQGRIEVGGEAIFKRIAAEQRPHIIFTAHLGNFELLPVAAAAHGLDITALFRPPNNPHVARLILARRSKLMGELLPSGAGAAFGLSRVLEKGGNIGLLVDQRFNNGPQTLFFGRPCRTNPLLAKLARHHGCDVYPARSIRLPGNRYRLEIEEKLALPHLADGSLDVTATMQLLTEIVERWIREHPAQWTWFHKRWVLN